MIKRMGLLIVNPVCLFWWTAEVVNRILHPPQLSNPLLWVQFNAIETNLLILLPSGVVMGRRIVNPILYSYCIIMEDDIREFYYFIFSLYKKKFHILLWSSSVFTKYFFNFLYFWWHVHDTFMNMFLVETRLPENKNASPKIRLKKESCFNQFMHSGWFKNIVLLITLK